MADENNLEKKSDDTKIETAKSEDARFDVSSLADVKDENGNGIFHMRTKTKWIAAISAIMLLITVALIYLTIEYQFGAETWQVAVWALCGVVAIYATFKRSLAALLFNLVLFFGVSMLPAWQMGYQYFRPLIERIFGAN